MAETVLNISGLYVRVCHPDIFAVDVEDEFIPFIDKGITKTDITIRYIAQAGNMRSGWSMNISQNGDRVDIYYDLKTAQSLKTLRGCLFHVPMDDLLLLHNRMILHASFVATSVGGVLFSGDSGSGKSTQAELWRRFRNATIVNGDRVILTKEKEQWMGYGSPYSGSSNYYVRQKEPIRVICLLEQAKENDLTVMSQAEAFRKLFLQISASHCRTSEVNIICDMLTDLLQCVSIYRLRCTPDESAVEVLEKVLMEEKIL